MFYKELLKQEINDDRQNHGKKPLKEKKDGEEHDDNDDPPAGGGPKGGSNQIPADAKTIKSSTVDPESGWFHKGEHKHVFAYAVETASASLQTSNDKEQVKLVTRHMWEPYMEMCEDIRHTVGMKELYAQRKETIERLFGTAKENHGFRYTQMFGRARMEMKVGLTFACMNLKKLAKMKQRTGLMRNYFLYFLCTGGRKTKCIRKLELGFAS